MQVARIDVRREIEITRNELIGERADPGADFEHAVADERTKRVAEPEVEPARSLELRQYVGSILVGVVGRPGARTG